MSLRRVMTAEEVLRVLSVLRRAGIEVWVGEGGERPFTYPSSCFVTGTVDGTTVSCLSAEQQAHFHQGYLPGLGSADLAFPWRLGPDFLPVARRPHAHLRGRRDRSAEEWHMP
ncbi:nucleotidyltransferase domain-containing protein [Streptomyces sp. NPDC012510]|uniref:nucleotidyltransferase domain-containing protein n=1 Tax=Streptomyces sp. NPDC012510 TaxID=3364838 RepID=UPI0036EFC034